MNEREKAFSSLYTRARARKILPPSSKLMMPEAKAMTNARVIFPPATQGGELAFPPPYLTFHTMIAGIIPNRTSRSVPEYSRAGRNAVGAKTATDKAGVSITATCTSRSVARLGAAAETASEPTFGDDFNLVALEPFRTSPLR